MKKGTIHDLQTHIEKKAKQRGFEHETIQETLLLLTEEIGELTKACRKVNKIKSKRKVDKTHKIGEEIADVITMVFLVGSKLGINIEKEFIEKDKIIDERIYK